MSERIFISSVQKEFAETLVMGTAQVTEQVTAQVVKVLGAAMSVAKATGQVTGQVTAGTHHSRQTDKPAPKLQAHEERPRLAGREKTMSAILGC
jgi:hypothetical protein